MRRFWTVLAALATLSLTNCGYNAIQTNDEQVKAGWSEVVNQYQRRADLVPNLVNSVKGFAQQEKDVLLGVTNARAKVGSIQATPEVLNDPAAFQKFQAAQGELSSALSRLLVVTENYPQLKSDALFRDLMSQLEGTENRITVARNRYIKAVQDYNVGIRTFPNNLTAMMFGYKEKPNFTVENEKEISTAPKVDFNPTPAPREVAASNKTAAMNAARASLLALLLCWACAALALVAVPPLIGRVVDQTGTLVGRRHRLADADAEGSRGAQGQPDRGADRADDGRRGHRAIFAARRGGLEDRPQEDRRRRAARHRQERPPAAHRGRLRPRRRADRRHRQAHHRRGHHAEIQGRRFRRRHFRRRRPDDRASSMARSCRSRSRRTGRIHGLVRLIDHVQSVCPHSGVLASAGCCGACWAACSARPPPAAS